MRENRKILRQNNTDSSRLETALAWGAVVLIGAGVLSFVAVLVVAALQSRHSLVGGPYQALAWIGYVGVPVGFLMLFTLLILNARRRSKTSRHPIAQRR